MEKEGNCLVERKEGQNKGGLDGSGAKIKVSREIEM